MYKLLLPLLILQTNILFASSTHDHDSDNHAYMHKNIDGSNTAIDQNTVSKKLIMEENLL